MTIEFNEEKHTYTNTETGEIYPGSTSLFKGYFEQFDKDYWSKNIAKKIRQEFEDLNNQKIILSEMVKTQKLFKDDFGIEVQNRRYNKIPVNSRTVLSVWENKSKKSQDTGTDIHLELEEWLDLKRSREKLSKRAYLASRAFDEVMVDKMEINAKVTPERLVYMHMYKVAGLADVFVRLGNDNFYLVDWKTNKKRFSKDDYHYNKHAKEPISHIPDTKFWKYALQQSLYAFMLEEEQEMDISGFCQGLYLIHIGEEDAEIIEVPYLRDEVIAVLEDYKSKQDEEEQ